MLGKLRTLLLAGLFACGGSAEPDLQHAPEPTTENPQGLAYPTDHLGLTPRRGSRPGDRIANLAFRGYRAGRVDGGLTTLSLADYYDPNATDHRALYIFAAASWCVTCKGVATQLESRGRELEAKGVRILVVVVNGMEVGDGPSLDELDDFAALHPMGLDLGLDFRGNQLGPYGLQGVPFDMLIDTRTMELLDAQVGEPDLDRYTDSALALTAGEPTAYP